MYIVCLFNYNLQHTSLFYMEMRISNRLSLVTDVSEMSSLIKINDMKFIPDFSV